MNGTYSHAGPVLREALIRAAGMASEARTQRDRREGYATAYAFGRALEVMRLSADTTLADGVSGVDGIPRSYFEAATAFLGSSADDILGSPSSWRVD